LCQCMSRIRLQMLGVKLAHYLAGLFRLGGSIDGFRNLGANLRSQRIGSAQLRIVAAIVNGRQNREQRLVVVQRHLMRSVIRPHLCYQRKQSYKQRTPKPITQEPSCSAVRCAGYLVSLRGSGQRVNGGSSKSSAISSQPCWQSAVGSAKPG